ncbi:MAG: hypothetical protein QOH41_1242 [Blastocatellia bacterium]|jgi:predicted short-subunit dehydrogenase-like oxidoreductase (DUF2520 family)|nr:hypothetical protein [Blastocatellia bacterium]
MGAGRLGTSLGLALKTIGYKIEVVTARRPAAARRAAKAFGPGTLALSATQFKALSQAQHDRLSRCSLILIATPDDVIAPVARQLSEIFMPERVRSQRVVLHTSGALASDVLAPMRSAGYAVGSLHPLVSISESRLGGKLLRHAFFSVEGDPAAVRVGKSIVKDLGGESFTIDSRQKALYHAAALTASPNMTALFDIAVEMLVACGLSASRARRILLPLVKSTVANLATQDPARALTGTFKRGDKLTVQKHLAALQAANLPQALTAYVVLGQRSISMARKLSANPAGLDEIARILAGAAPKHRRR